MGVINTNAIRTGSLSDSEIPAAIQRQEPQGLSTSVQARKPQLHMLGQGWCDVDYGPTQSLDFDWSRGERDSSRAARRGHQTARASGVREWGVSRRPDVNPNVQRTAEISL